MWNFWNRTARGQLAQAQAQLREAQGQLRVADTIFDTVQGIIVADARQRIQRVNRAFTELTGYSAEELIGKTPRLLQSGHHGPAFYAAMRESLARTGRWQGEIWDRRKDGGVFPKWLTISAVQDEAGTLTHLVATYIDISERKQAQETIHQLAFYDVLTQLPNRTLMHQLLQQATAASQRSGKHAALLLIDLDQFKMLNDSLGHGLGDALLQQAAGRLRGAVPAGAQVARVGGDEFAVILEDISDTREKAARLAEEAGEHILRTLGSGYALEGHAYHCTASIGVALLQGEAAAAGDVLKQAELAMYQAKAGGRNALHFFDAALEQAVHRRVDLERELRKAVQAWQFELHYQPQIDGGRVCGAEALLRWRHPGRGLISPLDFIPLAEETGLILPMGHGVLATACQQLARWARHPHWQRLTLAVNVSALQFLQADFAAQVLQVLQETGAPAGRLKLELTESLLVEDAEAVIRTMQALKAHGVQFSLDDFGTGYSSLSYLRRLPLDQLKIDQSFVRELHQDANAAAIARAVAALAHSLGLSVIAEGVETRAQQEQLAAMGCHTWQGYYFSRPLPLAELEAWLPQDLVLAQP